MRGCGVLLHISSLPGKGGIGSFGSEAREFVDFLESAGQSWWQVLPLTPPARGDSPYSSYSVFAGNPAFISLVALEEEGLLAFWTRKFLPRHTGERANYEFCRKVHLPLLRQTFTAGWEKYSEQLAGFRAKNAFWLEDYALFMAIKKQEDDADYHRWPKELLLRDAEAIAEIRARLEDEVNFWVWVQFLFFRQWHELKAYANAHGVGIIGDMPIYADADSADAWANPEVFQLNKHRRPTKVAGVPPDYFSKDGQLWGNPLYDWDHLKDTNYKWWLERLGLANQLYDMVRIDHFRALDEYYAIPADSENAKDGSWQPGPGLPFLDAVKAAVPNCRLIAEDLGVRTESLTQLLEDSGLPGMKILQFAFDPDGDSDYLPHNFVKNCVGYTGTHDNDTIQGWMQSVNLRQVHFAHRYLQLSRKRGYHWGFIRGLYATVADTVIVPMQDLLGLDSSARMNIPSTAEGNWTWRVNGKRLTMRLAAKMHNLAAVYRRLPK